MDHRYMSKQTESSGRHTSHSTAPPPLFQWLKNPTVLIVAAGILFTAFYQSLHSSPFHRHRHPGELLWDLIVTITPAVLLYAIDDLLNPSMFPVSKTLRPRTFAAKSELLRKLLGMDQPGGGIIGSVASAGRKSLSSLSSGTLLKRDCTSPAGLGNTDYSCFQNSILQGLASLQPLPEYLDSATLESGDSEDTSKGSSATTLQQLIAQLKDKENNGKTLWTPAKLKSLHSWEQQDAQEYFSKLLDEIEKEVTKATKSRQKAPGLESALPKDDTESQHSDDSGYQSVSTSSKPGPECKTARNPLEGMTAQRVACVQCGHSEGLSLQPFNCLTLNLGVGTMQHDLYELLDSYTHLEPIEQVECNKCTLLKAKNLHTMLLEHMRDKPLMVQATKARLEAIEKALEEDDFEEKTLKEKCKISAQHRSSSTKTKQVVIARPPRSLAIHVNRSVFDFNTGNMWKNLAAVKFPKTLDLGPWCLGSADESAHFRKNKLLDAEKDDITRDQETWVSDPRSSMISGDHYPSKISGPIYELRAVVTHQGRHENGHYICFRQHSSPAAVTLETSTPSSGEEEMVSGDDEKTLVDTVESEGVELKWWRLSDEHVWDVTEDDVLGEGGVFMLFYDCVDPNSVLVSSTDAESTQNKEARIEDKIDHVPRRLPATDESDEVIHELGTTTDSDLADVPTRHQDIVGGTSEDTFVSNFLSRPNSARSSMARVPETTVSPANSSGSFVLSLLQRPNA